MSQPNFEHLLEYCRTELHAALEREREALQALRTSESRLAESQRIAKIGSWELDFSTNALWWSEEIYCIFEIDPAQFAASYQAFLQLVHPEDREAVDLTYTESVANQTPYDIVHRLLMPDGRIKYLHEQGQTLYDDSGVPVRTIGTAQDITGQRSTEKVMHQTSELLRMVIAGAPVLIFALDREGVFTLSEGRALAKLGLQPGQVVGMSAFELYREVPGFAEAFCRALAGEEVTLISRVGQLDFEAVYAPYFDQHGNINGVIGVGFDITERRQAEEELRCKEAAIASSINGIAIANLEGRLTYVNQAFLDLWGYSSAAQLLGRSAISFWQEPEAATEVVAALQESGSWSGELVALRIDGTRLTLQVNANLFTDNADKPLGMLASFLNITERKQAEEALRLKDQAIATSLNAIVIADADGRIIYVNPAFVRLWGYNAAEDVLGKSAADFVDAPTLFQILNQVRTQGVWQGEMVTRRKDGKTFDVLLAANLVRDSAGKVINMVGSFIDISEAKHFQAQFIQAQKMEAVGRLAGGVAHDFNNLLTVMQGYLELVLMRFEPDDLTYQELMEVCKATESAAGLTQQLLAFSRKQIIAPQVLSLNGIIAGMQKMLQRLLGEDIELQTVLAARLDNVLFDPGQSEQIIVNLAINARDAMPDGGKLTIETANVQLDEQYIRTHIDVQPDDYVMLAVSDTGFGVSEEIKTHIFEPFFTTKLPGKGTGLGLAMVYGAVSQNGGRIEVYSEPGKGTTFKIYLPRVQEAAVQLKAKPAELLPRGTQTIILVEDDEQVRQLAAYLLNRQGYRVYAFRDGETALTAVAAMQEPPDLLITDVIMPGMNGNTLAEQIRLLQPAIKVLFTSGYTANVIVRHGVLKEGVEFLPKPYSVTSLARRVREVLDK